MHQVIVTLCFLFSISMGNAQTTSKFQQRKLESMSPAVRQVKESQPQFLMTDANDLDSIVTFIFDFGYAERDYGSLVDIQDSLLLSQTMRVWENNQWVNDYLYLFSHDEYRNEIGELNKSWRNNAWVNAFNYTSTYNEHQLRTEFVKERWLQTDWVNDQRYRHAYDANGNLTEYEYSDWNGEWQPRGVQTQTFDGENRLLQTLYQNIDEGEYINTYNVIYTYSPGGVLLYSIFQEWDTAWHNTDRIGYELNDQGLLVMDTVYFFDGVSWNPESLTRYEYNETGYETLSEIYMYDGNEFIPYRRFESVFSPENLPDYEVYREFDTNTQQWIDIDSTQYYYNPSTSTHHATEISGLSIFPNPVTDELHLDLSEGYQITGLASLISTIDGRIVRMVNLDSRKIDTDNLIPGSYMLVVPLNDLRVTLPFVKQ